MSCMISKNGRPTSYGTMLWDHFFLDWTDTKEKNVIIISLNERNIDMLHVIITSLNERNIDIIHTSIIQVLLDYIERRN